MYKHGELCPICGAGNLERRVVEETFEYKGHTTRVPEYVIYACAACGEALVDRETSKRTEKLLKEFGRQVDGLLTNAEIKRIRKKLGLTQEEMAEICGGGLKSFARYEAGQVTQSRGMDNLLRILDAYPFALDVLRRKTVPASAKVVSLVEFRQGKGYRYAERAPEFLGATGVATEKDIVG